MTIPVNEGTVALACLTIFAVSMIVSTMSKRKIKAIFRTIAVSFLAVAVLLGGFYGIQKDSERRMGMERVQIIALYPGEWLQLRDFICTTSENPVTASSCAAVSEREIVVPRCPEAIVAEEPTSS